MLMYSDKHRGKQCVFVYHYTNKGTHTGRLEVTKSGSQSEFITAQIRFQGFNFLL